MIFRRHISFLHIYICVCLQHKNTGRYPQWSEHKQQKGFLEMQVYSLPAGGAFETPGIERFPR